MKVDKKSFWLKSKAGNLIALIIIALMVIPAIDTMIFGTDTPQEPVLAAEEVPEIKPVEQEITLDANEILRLVNIERLKAGADPLVSDNRLVNSAKAKCLDMQEFNYFSHEDRLGNSPFKLISEYYPVYSKLGENLIEGAGQTESEFVTRWMESPEHKLNIVDSAFIYSGVYECPFDPNWDRFGDKHYIVQHFAE